MTTAEAKENISKEFIGKYNEWLNDLAELPEYEYGKKYGYCKPETETKDNLKAVELFQKYIFNGRYLPKWEECGYNKQIIWQLYNEGFLSYEYNSSWTARHMGRSDFYYITKATAKAIYKGEKQ